MPINNDNVDLGQQAPPIKKFAGQGTGGAGLGGKGVTKACNPCKAEGHQLTTSGQTVTTHVWMDGIIELVPASFSWFE